MRSSLRPISPPLDPAVALGSDQCEDDSLDGRPEPAAVSLEPAEGANVAPDAESQPEASIRDGDRDPDTQEGAAPLSAKLIQPWTPPRRPARLWLRPMAWLRSVPLTQSEAVAVETVSASPDSGSTAALQQAETAAVPSSEARDTTGDTPLRDPQHEA